jgi:DNA-binding NtrC family response regulator
MTAVSAASTLGNSWNRLIDCEDSGDEQRPPSLATKDFPQGKILMIVDDAVMALDLQRLLHETGYRVVGPATNVGEVQRMINRGDIDCAIVDLDVDRRAPLPIADLLAFAEVPFVYLTTGVLGPVPARHRTRPLIEKPFTRDRLFAALEKAMAKPRKVANDNRWPADGSVVPWTRVYPPL